MLLSTPTSLQAAIGEALADVPDVAFALVFGSFARGTAHAGSDIDVALGFGWGRCPGAYELGAIVSRLEGVASNHIEDLLGFCDTLAAAASNGPEGP